MLAVSQILSHYRFENSGVVSNLYRFLGSGKLKDTGKMVVLAVDQGFEHGPIQSYMGNAAGFDPSYHFKFAVNNGLSGYAAPLGQLQAIAGDYYGQIPLILKLNNSTQLLSPEEQPPHLAVTASVQDALQLGCSAIGFTIYPGSAASLMQFQELQEIAREAKAAGLAVVVWSYPRGGNIPADAQSAIDVVSYGAHLACLLGADIIKVKVPEAKVGLIKSKHQYTACDFDYRPLGNRIRHVVDSCFTGKRIVLFSGGVVKSDQALLEEAEAINLNGGGGSIIGRNCFQRPLNQANQLVQTLINIYRRDQE